MGLSYNGDTTSDSVKKDDLFCGFSHQIFDVHTTNYKVAESKYSSCDGSVVTNRMAKMSLRDSQTQPPTQSKRLGVSAELTTSLEPKKQNKSMGLSYNGDTTSDSVKKDDVVIMDGAKPALPIDEIGPALQAEFEQNGMHGVYGLAGHFLNKWKHTRLNIAITGRAGTGKSSFINAVRQVRPDHQSAAPVGVTQTTIKIEAYRHPENENLLLWDIPGVGTAEFPRDTYLKDIQFEIFDFYVILSSDRFMKDDLWLASEIMKAKKQYFFVRTKIDDSINNEKHDHPDTFKEEEVLRRIRQDCVESLRQGNMEGMPVFLLSSREPAKWDFRKTMTQLINDCPEIKKEVAVLTFSAISKEIIEKKKALLQKNIKLDALWSGCAGAVPIPLLNLVVDAALIFRVSQRFAKQFGLDKSSVTKIAAIYKVPVSTLQTAMQVYVFASVGEVTDWLVNWQFDKVLSTAVEFVPLVGSIVGGITSFAFTYHILNKILNDYEECAVTMLNKIEEHLKEKDKQM